MRGRFNRLDASGRWTIIQGPSRCTIHVHACLMHYNYYTHAILVALLSELFSSSCSYSRAPDLTTSLPVRHHRAPGGQHSSKLGKTCTAEGSPGSGNTRLSLPPIDDDQLQFRPRLDIHVVYFIHVCTCTWLCIVLPCGIRVNETTIQQYRQLVFLSCLRWDSIR